ncbi:efflux RND transporter permease subunit [Acetivibrio clariflavus]|uniref:efflux RND transporter permease subunit n=1 Tax=Acetivibrio clariflavus TaxID=288965 RepID=UPI0004826DE6|nr:MMPL family transporter [Acetivibrio clariflavus]
MEKIFRSITEHRKIVLSAFLIAAILCAALSLLVQVNYNMVDYLPKDAQSTTAIKIIEDEFEGEFPNAKVMLSNVSITEALEYKEKISAIDGVASVTWLDDIIGLNIIKSTPLEFLDPSIVKNYYYDNNALMTLSVESGKEGKVSDAVYELIGETNAAAGEAFSTAKMQEMSVSEVLNAVAILLPIIVIILIISTTSWIEPLLFLLTTGIAVIINMGTNIIYSEISFITLTVSPILQLAVSMDYAIFLLHSFSDFRSDHEPQEAMILAMKQSFSTVAASAATTVIGFAALIFMRFGIGADLGLNLFKGVALSFISVMVFLPAVTLLCHNAIDKTRHIKLIPSFKKAGNVLMKLRIPFFILALMIVVPAFLAQSNTEFLYGTGAVTNASRLGKDASIIKEKFGEENMLALLVPKEDPGKEIELCDALNKIPNVKSVVSYVTAVGSEIPREFVPEDAVQQFYSENYSRIIIYTDTEEESQDTFDTIQAVIDTAAKYYDTHYLAGQSATLFDMKNVVSIDTGIVNLLAIIGIFIVLLVTFRSLSLPFLLLFTIETAIWINLSFPYFSGNALSFIGYLIISTVQLGATVDYAILFTNTYLYNRKTLDKKDAMRLTTEDNLTSVLTSAGILATAGFALAYTSSNSIISDLGTLLGRGTLLSLAMVSLVLPALLVLFDGIIQKTTLNLKSRLQKDT